jgi:TolA-binding protein
VYPEPRVTQFIAANFKPVRLHVKTHPEAMERFNVQWTPTVLVQDANGVERHRIEGFLDADEFLGQLMLGAAQVAFAEKRFDDAEKRFREIVEQLPNTDAGPAGQYWAGVAKYKGSGDGSALAATAQAFKARYAETTWAKKASIWG